MADPGVTEIRISIPDKTADADAGADVLDLSLNRCRVPRCQKALEPGRDFCSDRHRSEWHNKHKSKS
jgi:hypothetical protein